MLQEVWSSRVGGSAEGLALIEPLDRGGFAVVWKGEPLHMSRPSMAIPCPTAIAEVHPPCGPGYRPTLRCRSRNQLACQAPPALTRSAPPVRTAARWKGIIVAAKLIEHSLSESDSVAARAEAALSASVAHPNVVSGSPPRPESTFVTGAAAPWPAKIAKQRAQLTLVHAAQAKKSSLIWWWWWVMGGWVVVGGGVEIGI